MNKGNLRGRTSYNEASKSLVRGQIQIEDWGDERHGWNRIATQGSAQLD